MHGTVGRAVQTPMMKTYIGLLGDVWRVSFIEEEKLHSWG